MNYSLSRIVSARVYAVLTIFALILSLFPVQFNVVEALEPDPNDSSVTICHATNSHTNQYGPNAQTVNASSIVTGPNGHDTHNGPVWYEGITSDWGDIIPEFDYDLGDGPQHYNGKNLTTEGQEILDNDCQIPLTSMTFDLMKKFSGPVPTGYTAEQFTFYIDGVDDSIDLIGDKDDEATGTIELSAGEYTIGENGPVGFIPSQWTVQWSGAGCQNIQAETTTITIDESDLGLTNFGCRADNQWRYGTLQVVKEIVGAEADHEDFSFSVTQGDMTHYDGAFENDGNNTVLVGTGGYTVTEVAAPGYTTTYSGDCDANGAGTMDFEDNQTCTVTNTWIDGSILGCTDDEAINYNQEATIDDGSCLYPTPACEIGENLLSNGSFEEPVIGSDWSISAITDWVITKVSDSTGTDGELWRGLFGGASDGEQNVELGANVATALTQSVATIVGATYELRFDFSPRPHTGLNENSIDALVDGTFLMNADGDGSSLVNNDWTTYSELFEATGTSTDISLKDMGVDNSLGSLVDNAVLCFVQESDPDSDPDPDPEPTYRVYGYVWHDVDEDGNDNHGPEEDEDLLSGWTVTITDGETEFSTTTDEDGYYYFDVPEGEWTISDGSTVQWRYTYPIDNANTHIVTVPNEEFAMAEEYNFLATVKDFFIPTAYAISFLPDDYGPYNFGLVYVEEEITTTSNSSSGGRRRSNSAPEGEVLGSSTQSPVGQVLGESIIPVGAPDTGAGGTSAILVQLPMLLAIMNSRSRIQLVK